MVDGSRAGFCAEILELCLYEHELVLCDDLISEVKRGLSDKIKIPQTIVREIILFLKDRSSLVEPELIPHHMCRYKNDLMILGTAKATQADVILTVDKDLLVLKHFDKTKILSPRQFWEYLRENN